MQTRKPLRLQSYDYSRNGVYFVTVCTREKLHTLGTVVGAGVSTGPHTALSEYGQIVKSCIRQVPAVEKYVIMPNHIHLLLQLNQAPIGQPSPHLSRIITQLKGTVTKRIGTSIWQKLYHDHVVRNQQDFDRIANYIFANPMRWKKDRFYIDT